MINYLNHFSFSTVAPTAPIITPCPDQIIGHMNNNIFTPHTSRINIDYITNTNGIDSINNTLTDPIVVVLESPHKYEYDPITGMALGPAMGTTGTLFIQHFASILSRSSNISLINGNRYDVVLVNAIQYQCSLGLPLSGKSNRANKQQRDNYFIASLSNPNNNDFIRRISAINPFAVINLCTIGLSDLQKEVENQLNNSTIKKNRTTGYHPSNWWNTKLMIIK